MVNLGKQLEKSEYPDIFLKIYDFKIENNNLKIYIEDYDY